MTLLRFGVLTLALPAALHAQTPAAAAPTAPAAPSPPASYRGFAPGSTYRDFVARAQALTVRDPLVCNTARKTAQIMECGVVIRDPADSATFYLSASVIEGRVAMVSFGDSGGPALVDRVRKDLTARFGPGKRTGMSTIEWVSGRKVARFNWRGRGAVRWIYIFLEDRDVTDQIAKYVQRKR